MFVKIFQNILSSHMFTYSNANTSLGQSERARTILFIYKRCYQLYSSLWACLHGGGGPQIGEVTCSGSPHLSCKRDQIKMRDYVNRRVTHQSGLPHLSRVVPLRAIYL